VFPDLTPGPGRLLVVVAHPDDETFGCGSLLLRAAAEGWTTGVVCATRGEAGEPSPGTVVPEGGLGVLREDELHAAAALLGVSQLDLLGFADSGMSGDPAPGTLAAADTVTLDDAVAASLDRFVPDVVVSLDASDGHRDHARMRDATVRLAAERGLPAYLQCLPQSLMRRWVAVMMADRPEAEHLALGDLGTPDDEIDHVLDATDLLPERERAMAAHRSQASPYDGLPADLRHDFLGWDRVLRAR